jgi:hypothetical protein
MVENLKKLAEKLTGWANTGLQSVGKLLPQWPHKQTTSAQRTPILSSILPKLQSTKNIIQYSFVTILRLLKIILILIANCLRFCIWSIAQFFYSPISVILLGVASVRATLRLVKNKIFEAVHISCIWLMGIIMIFVSGAEKSWLLVKNMISLTYSIPNVFHDELIGFLGAFERALVSTLKLAFNRIFLGFAVLGLFLATRIAHRKYETGVVKQLLTSKAPAQIAPSAKHQFASSVTVGANFDEIYFKKAMVTMSGTLWFSFTTGTECLDLLKQFEVYKNSTLTKSHFMTTQTNAGTTACVFAIETNIKPDFLPQHFPLGFLTVDLMLQNKYLFPEECFFAVDEDSLKITKNAGPSLGIFGTQRWAGQTEVSVGLGKKLHYPAVLFRLLCQKPFWGQFFLLLLTLLLTIMLVLPALGLSAQRTILYSTLTFISYLVAGAYPYCYTSWQSMPLWSSILLWQGTIVLCTQLLTWFNILNPNRYNIAITCFWILIAFCLDLLFWII